MKPKFQPTPSRISASQKCATDVPGEPNQGAADKQNKPCSDDFRGAEAGDQRPGEEARAEHGQHMPLDAEHRGIADGDDA